MWEDPRPRRHRLLVVAVLFSVLLHGVLGFLFRSVWPDANLAVAANTPRSLNLALKPSRLGEIPASPDQGEQAPPPEPPAPDRVAEPIREPLAPYRQPSAPYKQPSAPDEKPPALNEPPPLPSASDPAIPPLEAPPDRSEIIVSAGPSLFQVPAPPAVQTEDLPRRVPIAEDEVAAIDQQLREVADKLPELLNTRETLEWHQGQQKFSAVAEFRPAKQSSQMDKAVVTLSTEVSGERRETQIEFKRLAFSHYAQLINRWDPDVAISKDRVDGRFHANSAVNVDAARNASPTFTGKVTIAGGLDLGRGLRKSEVFLGGLETRARRISMPRDVVPVDDNAPLQSGLVQHFEGDTHITFFADGQYSWRKQGSSREQLGSIPDDGLFLLGGDRSQLWVEGAVRGKVVVYSEGRITIAGDLRYARDPRKVPDSPDFLGLISEGYVEVGPPDLVGPGDLLVQAAIYARRRFSVRSFRNRNRGTLNVYGSVTAGSVSATEPRYATRLTFDKRFEEQRPPNFPLTDHYELERWDRQWRVVRGDQSN